MSHMQVNCYNIKYLLASLAYTILNNFWYVVPYSYQSTAGVESERLIWLTWMTNTSITL
jgi:hypothetical protein